MNIKAIFGILGAVIVAALGTFFFLKFNTPLIGVQPFEPVVDSEKNSSSTGNPSPSPRTEVPPENSKNLPVSGPKETTVPNTFFTLLEGDSVFLAKDDGSFTYDTVFMTPNGDGTFSKKPVSGMIQPSSITKKFFQYYPDIYDFIVIFATYKSPEGAGGADYGYVVNNPIKGLGNITFIDQSKIYGSKGTLKATPVLHNIPTNKKFSDLAHELSHYWLMYVQNAPGFQINRDGAHWSNWMDTATRAGGLLYYDANGGLAYKDNSNGTFSMDPTPLAMTSSFHKFSSMSLYLMGLLPPSEVQPLTLWETSSTDSSGTMVGTKKTVTVDDIIKIAGPRVPAYPSTQRDFKIAFILLPKKGEAATSAQVESIKWIAENFPQEWNSITGGRSTLSPVK